MTVGAGNTNVAAVVSADLTATSASTNSSNGNDDVVLVANANIDINMSGATVATGYTLTGNTGAEIITGSSQADAINGAAGADTLSGGGGADVITGGAGVDSLTGGLGADDFIVNAQVSGAAAVDLDVIVDFTSAQTDQVGNFSIADIEELTVVTDVVGADARETIENTNALTTTAITGATDLDNISTSAITASFATAFTATTLATALSAEGDLALTSDAIAEAADGIIVFYDNNVDSFAAVATNAIQIANNATGAYVVTNLVQFKGVSDATTIATANLLAFIS